MAQSESSGGTGYSPSRSGSNSAPVTIWALDAWICPPIGSARPPSTVATRYAGPISVEAIIKCELPAE